MGYASANLLLVARSADLFGASVVMKETHEGIQADVELYHKIENRQVKPHDIIKVGQQLSDSVRTNEKVFNPYSVNYA